MFNYDTIDDVTEHFFSHLGMVNINAENQNVTSTFPIMLAHLMYNSKFDRKVHGNEFLNILEFMNIPNNYKSQIDKLENYFPSSSDLDSILKNYESDIKKINEILLRKKQPQFNFDKKELQIQNLLQFQELLFNMIINLSEELQNIKKANSN